MAVRPYPKISAKAWRTLRVRAAAAPTTKFTPDLVAALMEMASPESAQKTPSVRCSDLLSSTRMAC